MIIRVNKLLQPRIMAVVGAMGSGKTLFTSALGYRLKDNYLILANYDLKFRDRDMTPELVPNLMLEVDQLEGKKLMLLDEFHIFTDSRLSSSHHNILMSYFVTQTRKQNLQLIYTTQQLGQVDVRVRDNTDVIAFPSYDNINDVMQVIFHTRDILTGQFKFSHSKTYKNLKPVFEQYSTEQIMGRNMIDRIKKSMDNK